MAFKATDPEAVQAQQTLVLQFFVDQLFQFRPGPGPGGVVHAIGIETLQGTSWLSTNNGVVVLDVVELHRVMIGMLKLALVPTGR